MWAGVAGGMAEYFDLDPSLVRLLWVAATVVSGGLAIPVYILAWMVVPPDDRRPRRGRNEWRSWSTDFHGETQRLADEARRTAADSPATPAEDAASADPSSRDAASTPDPWWTADHYNYDDNGYPVEPRRRHPRSTGLILVGLGVLLLAANAGVFNWIAWGTMWPLVFIGIGLILLLRQSGWNR